MQRLPRAHASEPFPANVSRLMRFGRSSMPSKAMCQKPRVRPKKHVTCGRGRPFVLRPRIVPSWAIGDRSSETAIEFMDDLRARMADRRATDQRGGWSVFEQVASCR